ncbi:metalloreductase Fre8 [Jackrogersella minutella]|nr:metalloreductase Fre8 [Jackrogersella minutella]
MGWPYQFVELDAAQKQARRQSNDRYAAYAQLSALVPIAVVLLFRLGSWVVKRASLNRGSYSAVPAVPASPALKQRRQSFAGSWFSVLRRIAWWFGDDVVFLGIHWGQRDQIVVGMVWTAWLVFLCFIGVGNDYLHLTKRFGIIALSQFPLQYLLALKSLNPIAFAFGSSHEQINRWHRVLGWVIYVLLFTHASLYLNFYVQEGILGERLVRLIPALGLASIIGLSFMNATALKVIRRYSYRVFFITHLAVAMLLPPAIFFHSHHGGRQYVVEAILVFLIDLGKRKFDTITAPSVLELIPGTSLIKIVTSLPSQKLDRFRKYAGMHVYLSIPAAARRSSIVSPAFLLFEFAFNPFTIASVDDESGELTLVAKRQRGPMTKTLAQHAENALDGVKVPLSIEGPYGCATWFPNLGGPGFQRVLLVAGGVGATFILPLYRMIANENPAARVQMVWAVRGAGDATWPVTSTSESPLDDENIQLFLTGNIFANTSGNPRLSNESEAVELTSISSDPGYIHKRPDLQKIVDDLFRQGVEDRVAVLVCGPEEMARELRSYVGAWVKKGRNVWWHNESFAW